MKILGQCIVKFENVFYANTNKFPEKSIDFKKNYIKWKNKF